MFDTAEPSWLLQVFDDSYLAVRGALADHQPMEWFLWLSFILILGFP
jgi:hypothetical protein